MQFENLDLCVHPHKGAPMDCFISQPTLKRVRELFIKSLGFDMLFNGPSGTEVDAHGGSWVVHWSKPQPVSHRAISG